MSSDPPPAVPPAAPPTPGSPEETDVVVVGASAAGLATAACLRRRGIEPVVLEAADRVATSWRGHYDRLHLHTPRGASGLPGVPMPADYPRYPSRDQVVSYLEAYAGATGVAPRFHERVERIARDGERWAVRTADSAWSARHVVLATGYTRVPVVPTWPGQEGYGGEVLHTSRYRTGARFAGRDVLVVGFGNSAGEIAIDLCEHGARAAIAVRGGVNVLPRDLLGLPILQVGIGMGKLPPALADALGAPLVRLVVGDIEAVGLKRLPYGPFRQIHEHRRIPLLDIGTMALLRSGKLVARPGVERFTPTGVVFEDGHEQPFDAVVLGTGYRPALGDFLDDADPAVAAGLDERGVPRASGAEVAPGLWACGFHVAPSGMLREIGIEAERVAAGIAGGS